MRHCGEIGRHEGLKIPFWRQSTGSTPVGGIKRPPKLTLEGLFILLILHLAAAMNVSSSLLYKRIKALTDQSPSDFIKTVRMNHALKLLQSGQYTVTEVSELSGFSSLSIFSRAFKKHFGKTPTEI